MEIISNKEFLMAFGLKLRNIRKAKKSITIPCRRALWDS